MNKYVWGINMTAIILIASAYLHLLVVFVHGTIPEVPACSRELLTNQDVDVRATSKANANVTALEAVNVTDVDDCIKTCCQDARCNIIRFRPDSSVYNCIRFSCVPMKQCVITTSKKPMYLGIIRRNDTTDYSRGSDTAISTPASILEKVKGPKSLELQNVTFSIADAIVDANSSNSKTLSKDNVDLSLVPESGNSSRSVENSTDKTLLKHSQSTNTSIDESYIPVNNNSMSSDDLTPIKFTGTSDITTTTATSNKQDSQAISIQIPTSKTNVETGSTTIPQSKSSMTDVTEIQKKGYHRKKGLGNTFTVESFPSSSGSIDWKSSLYSAPNTVTTTIPADGIGNETASTKTTTEEASTSAVLRIETKTASTSDSTEASTSTAESQKTPSTRIEVKIPQQKTLVSSTPFGNTTDSSGQSKDGNVFEKTLQNSSAIEVTEASGQLPTIQTSTTAILMTSMKWNESSLSDQSKSAIQKKIQESTDLSSYLTTKSDLSGNEMSDTSEEPINNAQKTVHLIIALVIGLLLLLTVFGLMVRRCYDNWLRRHYQRMDFLIEGMYNGMHT